MKITRITTRSPGLGVELDETAVEQFTIG